MKIQSKMQPLATTQQMMTWLCMCPADEESTTPHQKRGYIAYTLAIVIMIEVCFFASMAYCIRFSTTDFDGAVFGFMCAIGAFGSVYVLIAAIRMRHQIGNIFASLSTIYKNSKFLPVAAE